MRPDIQLQSDPEENDPTRAHMQICFTGQNLFLMGMVHIMPPSSSFIAWNIGWRVDVLVVSFIGRGAEGILQMRMSLNCRQNQNHAQVQCL